jgi:xanthine dehydrogenase accessory factor
MSLTEKLMAALQHAPAVLVTVDATRGSVPREPGAWMAVFESTQLGTVGGGRLELDTLAHARAMLHGSDGAMDSQTQRYALGPSLGQCCGGEVHLRYERVSSADADRLRAQLNRAQEPVALFGGGHVGQALVQVLEHLPFRVTWIDSRDEIFPPEVADNVVCEHSDPVQSAVRHLFAGTRVLIMSFSHAEDLDIVAACLERQRKQGDLPFIGLIGSKTKWASFRQRLRAKGFTEAELAWVTCPIGLEGIAGKQPEVIAVSVAAQLLQRPRT